MIWIAKYIKFQTLKKRTHSEKFIEENFRGAPKGLRVFSHMHEGARSRFPVLKALKKKN